MAGKLDGISGANGLVRSCACPAQSGWPELAKLVCSLGRMYEGREGITPINLPNTLPIQ